MCLDCHAKNARQAQRRIDVLTLQRDCAIDEGLTPGAMLLAEIVCQRARRVDAQQQLARRGFAITRLGELVRPIAL